jgi:4-hydroxy-tetrahydrodipicolinate synthase
VTDDGVFAAYSEVIERVGDARLRIYVYHFPAMSAVPLGLPLIERLVKRYPESVVGMKDSTGDADAMIKVARALPGFAVFSGADQAVLPALMGGAVGSITAGANVACDLAQEIFSTYKGAPDKAAAAQERLSKVRAVLGSYLPLPAAVKAVLARHTNNSAWLALRPPLDALTAAQADDVWTKLKATGFTPAPVG